MFEVLQMLSIVGCNFSSIYSCIDCLSHCDLLNVCLIVVIC